MQLFSLILINFIVMFTGGSTVVSAVASQQEGSQFERFWSLHVPRVSACLWKEVRALQVNCV